MEIIKALRKNLTRANVALIVVGLLVLLSYFWTSYQQGLGT